MSEYNSLYVSVRIRQESLQQFFLEKPVPQHAADDWLTWWDSRDMYSKHPLEHIPHYPVQNNRAAFDQLLNDRDFGSAEHYDADTETWTFVSAFFSENYVELLPMLSLLKQLAGHQDTGGTGVAFIYDFFWGCHEVMAYLEFADQQARFKSYTSPTEIHPPVLEAANQLLEVTVDEFNKQFGD